MPIARPTASTRSISRPFPCRIRQKARKAPYEALHNYHILRGDLDLRAAFMLSMNIAGGNSSGTGNGAIVSAASDRIEGVTRPTATVQLYSKDWSPLVNSGTYSDSSVANDSGKFAFANVPHGYYNLIILPRQKKRGYFQGHPLSARVAWADTIDTLKSPGILYGFETSDKNDTLALSYIYIKGTPFHAMTDTHGEF